MTHEEAIAAVARELLAHGEFGSDEAANRRNVLPAAEAAISAYLAARSAVLCDVEPVAWRFELANYLASDGGYCGWDKQPRISDREPCVPEGSIRNLQPLHAPLSPTDTATAGRVEVKALEWVEQISGEWWIADRYRVEKFDGGGFAARSKGPQSGAFRTLCYGVSFEEAKAAAQKDYETRILSALTHPQPSNGDEVERLRVTMSAETVLAIRDALAVDDVAEAFHQLYRAVDPDFVKLHPWADLEAALKGSSHDQR